MILSLALSTSDCHLLVAFIILIFFVIFHFIQCVGLYIFVVSVCMKFKVLLSRDNCKIFFKVDDTIKGKVEQKKPFDI